LYERPAGTSHRAGLAVGGDRVTRRWIRTTAGLLLIGLLLAAVACGGGTKKQDRTQFDDNPTPIQGVSTAPAFPVKIERSDGQQLTVAQPPKRIVSLSPGSTEIIYAIGAEASLVAVDKYADFPDAAKNFPTRVDAYEPNVEAIAGMNPDLVLVANNSSGIVQKLDGLKIPVLYIDIDKDVKTVDGVLGQIRLLGEITSKTDQALALIDNLAKRVRVIRDALQGVDNTTSPRIYHELDSTFFTAADDTFVGDLYRILHVQNIAGGGGGVAYPQMTQEAIIAASPNVIILGDEDFGVTVDSVKARPGWSAIDAVKDDKVFGMNADIISRPGPRIVDALEQLAKYIYPEKFS
jgi:iron complex transport system substrate-binding protein